MFQAFLNWLQSLFFSKLCDIALIGLQNSGKTSLVNVLAAGEFSSSMIPTVGFNLRRVQKGNVTFKLWDIGGQPRFRSMWERYCRGVNAIVFIVDSADQDSFPSAKAELHALLEKPHLGGIPLLVLGNKNDLEGHAKVEEVISALALSTITNREVSCYSISGPSKAHLRIVGFVGLETDAVFGFPAKSKKNIDITLSWLIKRA